MDKHKDTTSRPWQNVMNIYGVGSRSAFDMSLAVRDIIDELGKAIPGTNCGDDLEKQFTYPPLEYIFVNNKTIPNGRGGKDKQKLSALTECELTFYANPENTLRMRYFIQVTHGEMIHGLSWIKDNSGIRFTDTDFQPVLRKVYADFLKEYDGGPAEPPKYGIWDGSGHVIGKMHNLKVKDFKVSGREREEVVGRIVSLMEKAMDYFKSHKSQINQIINK